MSIFISSTYTNIDSVAELPKHIQAGKPSGRIEGKR
jgi:hypothetical protein